MSAKQIIFLALSLLFTGVKAQVPTNGLELWLKADEGVLTDSSNYVLSWSDVSGNNYVASQTLNPDRRPQLIEAAINGRPAIRYDGFDDYLTAGNILNSVISGEGKQFTLFAVTFALSGENHPIISKNAGSNLSEDQRQLIFRVLNNKIDLLAHYTLEWDAFRGASGDSDIVGKPSILSFIYDGTRNGLSGLDRFSFFVDRLPQIEVLVFNQGTLGFIREGSAHVGIGASVNSAGTDATHTFHGDIAEVIFYGRLLEKDEREQIEAYLQEKYDLLTGINSEEVPILKAFELHQNYPNPFNPSTNFGFRISDFGLVTLTICDIQGKRVKTILKKNLVPGNYTASWDGTNDFGQAVASGVYIYRLVANPHNSAGARSESAIHIPQSVTRKMILLK